MIRDLQIPPSWVWARFQDVAEVASDLVDPTLTPQAIHIAPNHIESKTGRLLPYQTVADDGVTSPKHRFRPGQILYSKIRPYLAKAIVATFEGVCSADMYPINTVIEPRYLHQWLLTPWFTNEAAGHQGRSVLPKINREALDRLPVPIPPLAEQQRIVSVIDEQFTRLDAASGALESARTRLRRYRAAVLKAACEGRLVPTEAELARAEGREYEPADHLLERILQERRAQWEADQLNAMRSHGRPLGDDRWRERYREPVAPDTREIHHVPEGWSVASMDQLTSTITSGSRDWSQYYGEGTGTFLMAQNVRMGRLDLSFRQPVNPPEDDRDRVRSQVNPNDLLVTIVGANTGDVCKVPRDLPEHYVCQSVALMRPVLGEVAGFMTLYMTSPENGQKQYERYIYGAGRPHLSFDQLKMTAVLLPPVAEQPRIIAEVERRLSLIDDLEAAVSANLKRAHRLRQAILRRAFEGKLVPQDPADEPAGVMLEKIAAQRQPIQPRLF
jgi:type I restriction enzyme S subunit